jgi:CBS domain-containing protein
MTPRLQAPGQRRSIKSCGSSDEPLLGAAQLMSEHGVSHLVVVDPASGYPLGVLSTLDVAAMYAER